MKAIIPLLILSLSTIAFANEEAKIKHIQSLCQKSTGLVDASYVKEQKLKNGTTLYFCGSGSDLITGLGVIVVPKDQKKKEAVLNISSISDTYGQFGAIPVKIDYSQTGFTVTDYIPLEETGNFVSGVKRTFRCDTECVQAKKVVCAFNKIKKETSESQKNKLIKTAHSKTGHLSDKEIMMLYRWALSGDKAALKSLVDKKFLSKMDESKKGELGDVSGYSHNCVARVLKNLQNAKCI